MAVPFKNIYQFKVTLERVSPPVWRRIQVPENYSFWDLHVAIVDAMVWLDYHLHEFKVVDPATGERIAIGMPDEEGMDCDLLAKRSYTYSNRKGERYFLKEGTTGSGGARYSF